MQQGARLHPRLSGVIRLILKERKGVKCWLIPFSPGFGTDEDIPDCPTMVQIIHEGCFTVFYPPHLYKQELEHSLGRYL